MSVAMPPAVHHPPATAMRLRSLARLCLLLFCATVPPLRGAPPATFRRTIERVTSLDPAEAASVYAARGVALIHETLLEYDYEARPYRLIPGLAAELPQISADGLGYTFRLAPGARFHPDPCFGAGPGARRPDGGSGSRPSRRASFRRNRMSGVGIGGGANGTGSP